jgi:branched-subunit amino acid aminotransferase/4-amino-4-deoxychorismate lyase
MIRYYTINGERVPAETASLKVTDIGLLRGYGIFDFFLAREGHPLFLDDYLNRFYTSADLVYLPVPFPREQLKAQIYDLLEANEMTDAGVKLVMTGGYSLDGYVPADPNLIVMIYPLPPNAWEVSTTGIKLMSVKFQREVPEVKTTNYTTGIRLLGEMRAVQAQDLLYIDGESVRESVRSNFFIVKEDGTVVTPAEKILKGITRKRVIEVAAELGKIEIRDVHVSELATAKEAFLTSSTKGVMAVTRIDDIVIGDGKPGPIGQALQQGFLDKVHAYLESVKLEALTH